ncbi:hypothetical protein D3C81_2223360 [compost metagenome]
MNQRVHADITAYRQVLALAADHQWQLADLLIQAKIFAEVASDAAVGDQQVDAPALQFAEIGLMGRGRLAAEQH